MVQDPKALLLLLLHVCHHFTICIAFAPQPHRLVIDDNRFVAAVLFTMMGVGQSQSFFSDLN